MTEIDRPERAPGIVAAVVADGRLAEVRGAGVLDARTGAPMNSDAAFLWFSMTKIVTATAAMCLVDAGRLALDDPVERWVPGVLPAGRGADVQVRHLLQHSAGIPNPPPVRWVRPAGAPAPDPATFLRERFRRVRKLRSTPGARGSYTNLGYLLLGEVIAAASDRPFTDFATDAVLRPLGMSATSFAMPAGTVPVATGHQRLARGLGPLLRMVLPPGIVAGRSGSWICFEPFLVNGAAYGGLVGPVTDAIRVVLLHANDGALDGVRVLSAESVQEMRTISVDGKPFDHGLGWFRPPKDRDRGFVEHYGGGGGYYNLMRWYPDRGAGAVVMGNSTSYDVDAVVDELVEGTSR